MIEVRDRLTGQRDCHLPQLSAELNRLDVSVAAPAGVRRPESGLISGVGLPTTGLAAFRVAS